MRADLVGLSGIRRGKLREYLRIIMTAFLVMNCLAVYWLGSAIARSTRTVMAGLACQAAYLLISPLLFPGSSTPPRRLFSVCPQPPS